MGWVMTEVEPQQLLLGSTDQMSSHLQRCCTTVKEKSSPVAQQTAESQTTLQKREENSQLMHFGKCTASTNWGNCVSNPPKAYVRCIMQFLYNPV